MICRLSISHNENWYTWSHFWTADLFNGNNKSDDHYIRHMITKSHCSMPERLIQQFYGPYWAWVWLQYWWITSGKIETMSGKCQGILTGVIRGNPVRVLFHMKWGEDWWKINCGCWWPGAIIMAGRSVVDVVECTAVSNLEWQNWTF